MLRQAEDAGFDVLLTGDQNLSYQQNLSGRRLAIVSLSAQDWRVVCLYLPAIAEAVERAQPGSFEVIFFGTASRL